jgi:hypothetical protein
LVFSSNFVLLVRSVTGSIRGRRLRGLLVIAEMALALVLLAGSGLLLKSLLVMRNTAPGFDTQNLLAVDFSISRGKLQGYAERSKFFTDVLARAGSLPFVRSAALVADLPLGGGQDSLGFHIPGRPDPQPGKPFNCDFNIASPGYFRTMGIPVVSGREFGDKDSNGATLAIVVNEAAAKQFWPGEDPIGKRIMMLKKTVERFSLFSADEAFPCAVPVEIAQVLAVSQFSRTQLPAHFTYLGCTSVSGESLIGEHVLAPAEMSATLFSQRTIPSRFHADFRAAGHRGGCDRGRLVANKNFGHGRGISGVASAIVEREVLTTSGGVASGRLRTRQRRCSLEGLQRWETTSTEMHLLSGVLF